MSEMLRPISIAQNQSTKEAKIGSNIVLYQMSANTNRIESCAHSVTLDRMVAVLLLLSPLFHTADVQVCLCAIENSGLVGVYAENETVYDEVLVCIDCILILAIVLPYSLSIWLDPIAGTSKHARGCCLRVVRTSGIHHVPLAGRLVAELFTVRTESVPVALDNEPFTRVDDICILLEVGSHFVCTRFMM